MDILYTVKSVSVIMTLLQCLFMCKKSPCGNYYTFMGKIVYIMSVIKVIMYPIIAPVSLFWALDRHCCDQFISNCLSSSTTSPIMSFSCTKLCDIKKILSHTQSNSFNLNTEHRYPRKIFYNITSCINTITYYHHHHHNLLDHDNVECFLTIEPVISQK